ncbi:MAG: DEAD/DEAH box helicase family protein [Coriobacteriales bacterium]|nr:DEAD/DEAH box helicase family protein [Coriobacteriales bacterium]
MFFQQEVPAAEARTLGTLLLDDARRHCSKIGFDSYDRLFPTQDSITSDGLGNLIALPLQGAAVREGNSVFVDDDFRPFDDQWAFLSSVERVPASTVHELAEGYIAPAMGSGKLRWNSKKNVVAADGAVTEAATVSNAASSQIDITLDGMVQLRKDQLSQPMVTDLSSLAAMANPEFFLKQRMHQRIYPKTTPRYLWFGEETDVVLRLPRGCQNAAMSYLRECGCKVDVHDKRTLGRTIHANFVGTLRAGQGEAAGALAQYDDGMLVAPTGFGKTVVAANLIANKGVSTLVLVPSSSLLDQWRESLEHFLQIHDDPPVLLTPTGRKKKNQPGQVGVIGGGKKLPSGIVDIALVSSLMQNGKVTGDRQVSDLVSRYGMVLVDEAQHVPASGLVEVLKRSNAKYVYGLTATPRRKDRLDRALQMFLGPVRMTVKPDAKERVQRAARVLVPRFTGIRPPADMDPADWNGLLDVICSSEQRNAQIADDAYAAVVQGRYPLVLTRRVDHARTLAELIQKRLNECPRPKKGALTKRIPMTESPTVITLVGSDGQKTRRERLDQIRNLPTNQPACIVATDSYVGEGFDEPRLDTLLLAAPVAWEGLLTQLVGRIQRQMPGKADVCVYDYIDELVPLFARQWHGRLKAYAKLGYVVRDAGSGAEPSHIVTAGPAATALLQSDIQRARAKIALFSAWVAPKAVDVVEPALREAVARGVEVSVVVPAKPGADGVQVCLDRLEQMGCRVTRTSGKVPSAAVFDAELVWFGGIPPLAFARSDDCSVRIVNRELAGELTRS